MKEDLNFARQKHVNKKRSIARRVAILKRETSDIDPKSGEYDPAFFKHIHTPEELNCEVASFFLICLWCNLLIGRLFLQRRPIREHWIHLARLKNHNLMRTHRLHPPPLAIKRSHIRLVRSFSCRLWLLATYIDTISHGILSACKK